MRRVFLFDDEMRHQADRQRRNDSCNQNVDPFREQNLKHIRQIDLDLVFVPSHLFQSFASFLFDDKAVPFVIP